MKPQKREHRFIGGRLEVKKGANGAAVEDGTFSGLGAVFGRPHPTSSWALPMDWMDIIQKGAFTRTLADHKAEGTMPALCWQHDIRDPIGAWQTIEENGEGLAVEGKLCLDEAVENGPRAYALMKMGGLRGLSIGMTPVAFILDQKAKIRTLTDIDLYEISPVTVQAVPGALVSDVKAMTDDQLDEAMGYLADIKSAAKVASDECKDCKAYDPNEEDPDDDPCWHLDHLDNIEKLAACIGGDKKARTRVASKNPRIIEKSLRDAGFSRSEAKRFAAAGFKSLAQRDAGAGGLLASLRKASSTLTG